MAVKKPHGLHFQDAPTNGSSACEALPQKVSIGTIKLMMEVIMRGLGKDRVSFGPDQRKSNG